MISLSLTKVLLPAVLSFLIGFLVAPHLASFLERHKLWKKKSVALTIDGQPATISASLHNDEMRTTPRMGGAIVWLSVFVTALSLWLLSKFHPTVSTVKFDFISRSQTWLPLAAMCVGAIVGLIDDLLVVEAFRGKKGGYIGGGLAFSLRLLAVALLGLFAGAWFYFKLGEHTLFVPFVGFIDLALFYIPFFVIVTVALFSTGVIDGVDGLAGGVLTLSYSAMGLIALIHNQVDIATLSFVVVGGLLAFLWFNVPPARFYMSETGMLSLLLGLAVISFMTKTVAYLPIICLPLFATTFSVIVQLLSKRFLKRKVFLVAPLHHHFEAKGWSRAAITMRYWIIASICALLGIVAVLLTFPYVP
jgi:phospho-N-acetylmuramoyl-pentapeptide-transferase